MGKEKQVEAYEVPALVVTPEKPVAVTGNFEAIEQTLQKWAAEVSKVSFTEKNLDQVQSIKRAIVAVRNQIDARVDATKKLLFNDPKRIFEGRVKLLYSVIASIEGKTDEVLGKIEQKRRDDINKVLDYYKAEFQEQYKLDEEYLSRVEYRRSYYNKGIGEKERKDDLESQFDLLKKEQDAHVANIRLIRTSCNGEPRLNVDRYIRDLTVRDVATIVEEIVAERERLRKLDSESAQTATAPGTGATATETAGQAATEDTAKLVLGIADGIDFTTDFPGRTKSIKIQITYPCDMGDALQELFTGIAKHGIKIKELKEEVAF